MEDIKQEEIKQEETTQKVDTTPSWFNESVIKNINDKLDILTKENTALKEEIINLKNKPVESTPPKKVERSFKFIKEIF